MLQVGRMGCGAAFIALALLLVAASESGYSIEVGILAEPSSDIGAGAHWDWAIRGSTIRFLPIPEPLETLDPEEFSLIALEDRCLSDRAFDALEAWTRSGGLLIVNGPYCRGEGRDATLQPRRVGLGGLELRASDPGLSGVYPRMTEETPLLTPFVPGDGIRFGRPGISGTALLDARSTSVLARGYRIEPGPGEWVRSSDAITIASRRLGQGRVVFLNFSLAEITACYPNARGQPTDCSGAGTARALMRNLVANLLWEENGQQIPLRWETPGSQPVGVVLTGDVHADEEAYQVRSARLMGKRVASRQVPLTYFVVGDVAARYPEHFESLEGEDGIFLGPHSAHGEKYEIGGLAGARAVHEDIRKAEALLGMPSFDNGRRWRAGVRSHGWASDESRGEAWSAMHRAGISVVFDHNADSVLPDINASAPLEWFEGDVRKRLFVPMLEKSVHTEADDFVLSGVSKGGIFSVGSPEPDPCCNWAVTFDAYTEYVRDWHQQLLRLGTFGGATEVWLWHPSTPVWKGGLKGLASFVESLVEDDRVELFSAHEFATWAYNRERVRVTPSYASSGRLDGLSADIDQASLVPLPPGARRASGLISYWVIGSVDLEGWNAERSSDPAGRTVTILSRPIPDTRRRP